MSILEKRPGPDQTAANAAIFLENIGIDNRHFPPPEDFMDGFVSLGGFELFSETGEYSHETQLEIQTLVATFESGDVKLWVTPDKREIFVAIKNGAESRIAKTRQEEALRQLGRLAVSELTS